MSTLFDNAAEVGETSGDDVANLTGAFTYAVWYWTEDPGGNRWSTGTLVSFANAANEWEGETFEVKLYNNGDRYPVLVFNAWFADTNADHQTGNDQAVDAWSGIAVSYDPSDPSTSPEVYVDGSADAWDTDTNGVGAYQTRGGDAASPDTVAIGKYGSGDRSISIVGGVSNTSIAEMAIWSTELSAAAKADVTGGSSALYYSSNLIWYDRFDTYVPDEEINSDEIVWESNPSTNASNPDITYPGAGGGPTTTSKRARIRRHFFMRR